jgi:AcrR family transcriptional regulator
MPLSDKLTHLTARFPDASAEPRDRILQAAADLFTRHGYEATSTDAIARAAGVKPPGLYRAFASKEAILYAFVETVYEGFLEDMQEAVAGVDDPVERLARLAWAHTWLQLSTKTIPRAHIGTMFSVAQLLSSLSDESFTRLRALAKAHVLHCRTVIEDGQRRGLFAVADARTAALALTTMCEYSALWFRADGPLSAEEVADCHAVYALRIVQAEGDDLPGLVARATGRVTEQQASEDLAAVAPRHAKEEGHADQGA